MAINYNNQLDTLHTSYTAMSGGGKGVAEQFSTHEARIPDKPHLAIFNPYKEFAYKRDDPLSGFRHKKVYFYKTKRGFANAFKKAWYSGQHFYIAYTPDNPTREDMLWFCGLMWEASDGNRRLDALIMEVAKWSLGAGAEPYGSKLGECMTGGRKYGLVMHLDFQTPSEVSKSITKQCTYKVVGAQEAKIECRRMADEIDKAPEDIGKLKKCTYWVKKPGWENVEFMNLRHKIPKLAAEDKKKVA